jgi:hypothetical protein
MSSESTPGGDTLSRALEWLAQKSESESETSISTSTDQALLALEAMKHLDPDQLTILLRCLQSDPVTVCHVANTTTDGDMEGFLDTLKQVHPSGLKSFLTCPTALYVFCSILFRDPFPPWDLRVRICFFSIRKQEKTLTYTQSQIETDLERIVDEIRTEFLRT